MPEFAVLMENGNRIRMEDNGGVVLVENPTAITHVVGAACAGGNHFDVTVTTATLEGNVVGVHKMSREKILVRPTDAEIVLAQDIMMRLAARHLPDNATHAQIQARINPKKIDVTV